MPGGILQNAQNVVVNSVEVNEINHVVTNTVDGDKGAGIKALLKASMPNAFHDSSARDPPPHCHSGTRQGFINQIVDWGGGRSHTDKPIFWMGGPAGVGKSAVAQTCAELLAEKKKLGAAFFFSRSSKRNNPIFLFPSISYQITTTWDAYADVIDYKIRRDPTIVEKSLKVQFRELLVKPLQELAERREGPEATTIIIDGLDECIGIEAQRDIINIIAMSAGDATTPFRWAFFSRPEPHIKGAFSSDRPSLFFLRAELPVSRGIDPEILSYLTAEFKKIREDHGLPPSWPSGSVLGTLVGLSAGLFLYASIVIRFVRERNSSGPVDQLNAIVSLATGRGSGAGSVHPLSELDLFYMLSIMRNVPSKVLQTIQRILLFYIPPAHKLYGGDFGAGDLSVIGDVLGLTEPQINNAFAMLSSVLEVKGKGIKFYHASFPDFMQNPDRSKEFCPHTSFPDSLRRELLERINDVCARSQETDLGKAMFYRLLFGVFFGLCQSHPLDPTTTAALTKFPFQMIPRLLQTSYLPDGLNPILLEKNIPVEFRQKVVRRSFTPMAYLRRLGNDGADVLYILGRGKNKALCRKDPYWRWC